MAALISSDKRDGCTSAELAVRVIAVRSLAFMLRVRLLHAAVPSP